MNTTSRTISGIVAATALFGGAMVATAGPAAAASYHCTTSKHSVDNPAYGGVYADNFDFSVQLCAKRSSGNIYTYAKISWDEYGLVRRRPQRVRRRPLPPSDQEERVRPRQGREVGQLHRHQVPS